MSQEPEEQLDGIGALVPLLPRAWLQAGLDPSNPEDFRRIVRIYKALVELDEETQRRQSGKGKIALLLLGAGFTALFTAISEWLPKAYNWLFGHISQ